MCRLKTCHQMRSCSSDREWTPTSRWNRWFDPDSSLGLVEDLQCDCGLSFSGSPPDRRVAPLLEEFMAVPAPTLCEEALVTRLQLDNRARVGARVDELHYVSDRKLS